MTDSFPDISSKLGAPTKKSLFERQKAEAEAKKARERAETAAVYEDFVKSFDDDEADPVSRQHTTTLPRGPLSGAFVGTPGKRHFTSTGLKSGPGSLGPSPAGPKSGPGSLGHSAGQKRSYNDFRGAHNERERSQGIFSYDDDRRASGQSSFQPDDEDKSETNVAPKPTLHLSFLPPGTSPAVIKALLAPSTLVVENVRILPLPATGSTVGRKSTSAIVTLAADTAAADIDTLVSHLQHKYLGFGFNLAISRHLSSAALGGSSIMSTPGPVNANLPFNARPVHQHASLSRAPPPSHSSNRYAPPSSYASSAHYGHRTPATQVTVSAPSNLKQLKIIHKTLESLLTYGPEFEALLMSRPHIQQDERWAWLWDSKSVGGMYYRWRLWDILTKSNDGRGRRMDNHDSAGDILFESQSLWLPPQDRLKFEYTTRMADFVSDDDYDSSDEEDDDDRGGGISKRYNDHNMSGAGPPPEGIADPSNDGAGYLNPLTKTKLIHLLTRLPETNSKLRRGDVARITTFAIEHAGAGADEVVELVTQNVVRPLCISGINRKQDDSSEEDAIPNEANESEGQRDTSTASLVGLYVISDILSSSASAGVRHAWRYRALFENALRYQTVFEHLGRIDKQLGWGKLKAEKWKRSVQSVLNLWEGWSVFPQTSHEKFLDCFLNPPQTEAEKVMMEAEEKRAAEEETSKGRTSSKWRSVGDVAASEKRRNFDVQMEDGHPMQADNDDKVDGQPMQESDDDVIDEHIDGIPMADSSDEEMAEEAEEADEEAKPATIAENLAPTKGPEATTGGPAIAKRQRPKAVDMFADDESDG